MSVSVEAYGYCITGVFHFDGLNSTCSAKRQSGKGKGSYRVTPLVNVWRGLTVTLEVKKPVSVPTPPRPPTPLCPVGGAPPSACAYGD